MELDIFGKTVFCTLVRLNPFRAPIPLTIHILLHYPLRRDSRCRGPGISSEFSSLDCAFIVCCTVSEGYGIYCPSAVRLCLYCYLNLRCGWGIMYTSSIKSGAFGKKTCLPTSYHMPEPQYNTDLLYTKHTTSVERFFTLFNYGSCLMSGRQLPLCGMSAHLSCPGQLQCEKYARLSKWFWGTIVWLQPYTTNICLTDDCMDEKHVCMEKKYV